MEIEDGKWFSLGLIWNFRRHLSVLEKKKIKSPYLQEPRLCYNHSGKRSRHLISIGNKKMPMNIYVQRKSKGGA